MASIALAFCLTVARATVFSMTRHKITSSCAVAQIMVLEDRQGQPVQIWQFFSQGTWGKANSSTSVYGANGESRESNVNKETVTAVDRGSPNSRYFQNRIRVHFISAIPWALSATSFPWSPAARGRAPTTPMRQTILTQKLHLKWWTMHDTKMTGCPTWPILRGLRAWR